MGIFGKTLRSSVVGGGSLTDHSDFWYGLTGGGPTKSGVSVNEETAMRYLAIFSCVSLKSQDMGSLPLILYKTGKDGSKKRATDERLYDILHNQPNKNTDSMHWRETGQNHLMTWGNFYSDIKRHRFTGEVEEITQIVKPGGVSVKRNRKGVFYEWRDHVTGKMQRRVKKNIFHLAGFGNNGLVGMSVIANAREAIALGIAVRDYGAYFFGQGTHPSGTFEMDGVLGDNEKHLEKELAKNFEGLGKSHKAMLLQKGMKFKTITIPPNDSQFLESRKATDLDVCGMYHIPPHKIAIHGQNSNLNNLEQENSSYVSQCLRPDFVRWEQAMNMQLLTPDQRSRGLYTEILAEGLLRGDQAARSAYYDSQWSKGAMSANDINKVENRNPVPGGDQYFVPLNFIPSDQAADFANQDTDKEQNSKRQIEHRAKNSILLRDRIAKRYYPLLQKAGQDIVDIESIAVKRQVKKQQRGRENRDMQSWLDSFYRKFPDEIKKTIGPVIRAYAEAISEASISEMGIEDDITKELDTFINDYIETYADRHTQSSLGQLTQQLDDSLDALTVRVDEWEEKRSKKIADDEAVRNSNAVYQFVAFGAGLSTVWRIRGKTCPYCTSLSGKRVLKGQSFVKGGDEIDPEGGTGPMRFSGMKQHPPLHQKCLPGNANVTAFGITASSEDWFDGNLIIIHTASGNKISCTPNHPILTCHGWVNADKINIGNQVRKAIHSDGNASIIRDGKNVKALIKDVAKSFIDTSKMIAVPVPATSEYFKSDFPHGKITIIRTDGSLLLERDPILFHKLREFNLKLGNLGGVSLVSDSSFTSFVKARFPSKSCLVGSKDLLISLGGSHALPIEQTGFALPTEFDPVHSKIFINNHPGNSEAVGNGIDRFPIEVLADEVVRIENNVFHGLVYNLRTKDNLFYAENIVVHNCDCYLSIT